jgi:hypothetical protein
MTKNKRFPDITIRESNTEHCDSAVQNARPAKTIPSSESLRTRFISRHHRKTAKSGKSPRNETGNCCATLYTIINSRSPWFTVLHTLKAEVASSRHLHCRDGCCLYCSV